MSVQIHCLTKHSTKPIIFTLIGNDFTDRFLEKLKWVKQFYHFDSIDHHYPLHTKPWDNDRIKSFENSIKRSIQWLNDNGYCFPIPVDEILLENDSASRNLLNRLHRHFTTGHKTVSHVEPINTWLYDSAYTFEFKFDFETNSYEEFNRVVHNINTRVHQAEQYYLTEPMRTFPPFSECSVMFNSTKPIDPALDPQNEYLTEVTSADYQYFSDDTDSYDVWLPLGEMQGKNYYGAYFDQDDPTHWDVFTNHYYSGSFTFTDRGFMKHPDMVAYLKRYGVTPGPLTTGIPLGKITQGKELLKHFDIRDVIIVSLVNIL